MHHFLHNSLMRLSFISLHVHERISKRHSLRMSPQVSDTWRKPLRCAGTQQQTPQTCGPT